MIRKIWDKSYNSFSFTTDFLFFFLSFLVFFNLTWVNKIFNVDVLSVGCKVKKCTLFYWFEPRILILMFKMFERPVQGVPEKLLLSFFYDLSTMYYVHILFLQQATGTTSINDYASTKFLERCLFINIPVILNNTRIHIWIGLRQNNKPYFRYNRRTKFYFSIM